MASGLGIGIGIVLCAASVRAAGTAPQAGISIHPSLGAEVFAWPFGFGVDGALWVDSGPFMTVVHLAGGVLAAQCGRFRANQVEVVVGLRASVPFARDATVNEPPGPPLPRAALLATLRL